MIGRVMLLLLIVSLVVVGLAWVTGPAFHAQAAAPGPGPGEAAWLNRSDLPQPGTPWLTDPANGWSI
jgi:hypothetical protein